MHTRVDLHIDRPAQLVDRLTAFLRARWIYPSNHGRVLAAAEALLDSRIDDDGSPRSVAIAVDGLDARVDGVAVPMQATTRNWLVRILRESRLGGIRIDGAAGVEDLITFSDQLISRLRAGKAAAPWPSGASATSLVEPLDLRVVGRHGGECAGEGEPESGVGARIAENPQVRERLDRLQKNIDQAHDSTEPTGNLDLLPLILDVALADAAMDETRVQQVVCEVLDCLGTQLDRGGVDVLQGADSKFSQIAQDVAQRYFGRRVTALPQPDADLPTGRPEDANIQDNLNALLDDFETLPVVESARRIDTPAEVRSHVAKILFHLTANGSSPDARSHAAERLVESIDDHDPRTSAELRQLLADASPATARRVAPTLLATPVGPWLLRSEVIPTETLAAGFPNGFAELVAKLPSADPQLVRVLDTALRTLPLEWVVDGLRSLAAAPDRPEKLALALAACSPEVLELVGEAAPDPQRPVRQMVLTVLSALKLPSAEGAAFRIVPPERLDPLYLRALCQLGKREQARADAHRKSNVMLRRFIDDAAGHADLHENRLLAVRALAMFPSADTRQYLDDLRRGWSIVNRQAREIRAAATATRKQIPG